MNFWYIAAGVAVLIYITPVLLLRLGINKRAEERRLHDRRVQVVHVPVERRVHALERRQTARRA